MYQVFQTKGEYEPWWFFEDWQTLITEKHSFMDFKEALSLYQELETKLTEKYPSYRTKRPYLTAFWDNEEKAYCDACSDDIQIYYGVMLLKDDQIINMQS